MPAPIIIIGAGLAGLWTALNCAKKNSKQKVLVITAAALGHGAASAWAQGGIAAAFGKHDAPSRHLKDTLAAGGGINNEKALSLLTNNIQSEIKKLSALGVRFDHNEENFLLSREAGHSQRRIVRSAGDMAGQTIMRGISQAAMAMDNIEIIENTLVGRLALDDSARVIGVFAQNRGGGSGRDGGSDGGIGGWERILGSAVVLAAGGIGQLYKITTNPPQALGHGLGLAALAGASIADAEFVQFHPTALDLGIDPAPLATEALRGEGALLLDSAGHRFMLEAHQAAELAPRDIVAREVARAIAGGGAFLDATTITSVDLEQHFPLICQACSAQRLNPKKDLIPIAVAAHYHMGGVVCNEFGSSSLEGLWVCGESAANGIHGANRLAGNSLGEALVFANLIAETISLNPPHGDGGGTTELTDAPSYENTKRELKNLMTAYVGVSREQSGLMIALDKISKLERKNKGAVLNENMLAAAKMIVGAALARTESRGAHWRADYPHLDKAQARRTKWTIEQIANNGIITR